MSERARHRADLPPSTPLTGLSTTHQRRVGDHAAALSRTGMIVAVSSVSSPAWDCRPEPSPGRPPAEPFRRRRPSRCSRRPRRRPRSPRAPTSSPPRPSAPRRTPRSPSSTAPSPPSRSRAPPRVSARRRRHPRRRQRLPLPRPHRLPRRPPGAAPARHVGSPGRGDSVGLDRHRCRCSAAAAASTIVAIAMRYLGVPYVYGGASPRGFDCSGLTNYVFAQLGVSLARSADGAVPARRPHRALAGPGRRPRLLPRRRLRLPRRHLPRRNQMIAAPHTGEVVRVQPIYSSNIAFGRP